MIVTRTIYHYDNHGNQLGVLHDVSECTRDGQVNGEHTMEVRCKDAVDKEDRLVLMDEHRAWREYIVADVQDDDSGEGCLLTCEDSLSEIAGTYIENRRPTGKAPQLLAICLEGTRWEALPTHTEGEQVTQVWYHTNARKILDRIASTFGGEIYTEIEVEGARVVARRVGIAQRVGADHGRRFEYARDLLGVTREWGTDKVYTRVWGYGSGVEAVDEEGEATGGYTRKITFGDLNGGKDYVESEEALQRWGIPDGHGGLMHVEGVFEDEDCKDPAELLRLTTEWAEAQYDPDMTYTVSVADLGDEPVAEGDDVAVVDRAFDPPLRIKARVVKTHIDDGAPENSTYTLGKVPPIVTDTLMEQAEAQKQLTDKTENLDTRTGEIEDKAPGWDQTTETVTEIPGDWLRKQMDRLNQEFNNAGKCYKFESLELGSIWANGPVTADGKPESGTDHAVNLCSLGMRIAKAVRNGDFDYTTFITGDGATANCINVGTLRCGDNYLNLDTGEMRIALTAKVGTGNTTVSGYVQNVSNTAANNAKNDAIQQADANTQEYLEDYVAIGSFDSYLTMRNTFNALTHNGADKGFFIDSNKVFINADYVRTGILESQNGQSVWDLNNGYFETASSGWSGGQYHGIHTRLAGGQYAVKMDQTDIGTISTYSQGNVHPFGIKVFTDLVLSAPGGIGVGYTATTQSGLTYTSTMRSGTINYVESVSGGGDSAVTVTRRSISVMQGLITGTSAIANATFSTPIVEHIALAASTEPIDGIDAGGAIPVELVSSTDQLMQAADESRPVWQVEPENLQLGMPVYTGEEWTMGVPTEDPRDDGPTEVELPTTALVAAQAQAMQSEIDAIADALTPVLGATAAKALRARTSVVRAALNTGEVAAISRAAVTKEVASE